MAIWDEVSDVFENVWDITTKIVDPFGLVDKAIDSLVPETPSPQTGIDYTKPATDNPINVIYGTRKVSGTIVWAAVGLDKDKDDIPNDLLHLIVVWGEGGTKGVKNLLIDGVDATDDSFDGWLYAYHFNNGFGKNTHYENGSSTTSYQSFSGLSELGWDTAHHKLENTTCSYIRMEWNGESITNIGSLEAVVEGRYIFDPRDNETKFTNNRFLCAYDYITNPVFGKNLNSNDLNEQSFIDAVNIADTQVQKYTGGPTEPMFICNAIIDTSKTVRDNFLTLIQEGFAQPPILNGKLTIDIKGFGTAVDFELNHDNCKQAKELERDQSDFYNRIIVKFPDESQDFKSNEVVYPPKNSALFNQYFNEDNQVLNEKEVTLTTVTNAYDALQYAEVLLKENRTNLPFSIVAEHDAFILEPGDIVPVYNDTLFLNGGEIRVLNRKLQDDGSVLISAIKHNSYPWTPKDQQPAPNLPNYPDITNPAAPTELVFNTDDTGRTQGTVSWNSVYEVFYVEITKNGNRIYSAQTNVKSHTINGFDAASYVINVYAINSLGYKSNSAASINISIATPANPVLNLIKATYNTLALQAKLPFTIDTGGKFIWQYLGQTGERTESNSLLDGTDYFTFTGLSADTNHIFRVKYKNLAGESDWVESQFSTLDNVDDIIDLISENGLPQTALNQETQDLINQLDRDNPNNIPDALEQAKNKLNLVELNTYDQQQKAGEELLLLAADYSRYQKIKANQDKEVWRWVGALAYVDDENGQIVNRAFEYTESKFSEASTLIDGVNSSINLQTKRITDLDEKVISQSAEIELNKSAINLRATYSEVQNEVTRAIESIQPAYSWQFNTTADGWAANNGTINATAEAIQLTWGDISISGISFAADDNPILTIRYKRTGGSGHAGTIKTNGTTLTPTVADVPNDSNWYVKTIDLSADDNYSGTITNLQLILGSSASDTFDIDYIIVGKRSDQLIELEALQARVTDAEQTLDPENGRWAQYVTTTWFNDNAVKTSDVRAEIDSFNSTYSITATLEELDENDVITKANSAQQWISAADSNITNVVTAYLNEDGGLNEQLSTVQSTLDAQAGLVSDQAIAIQHVNSNEEEAAKALFDQAAGQFSDFRKNLSEFKRIAVAIRELESKTDDNGSFAQSIEQLATKFDQHQAYIDNVSKALSNSNQATAIQINNLRVSQQNGDSDTLAQAQAYTRATIGYCVDENGQPTGHETAAICVAAGHEWLESPLAEAMQNLMLSVDGATAKLSQIAQLFKNVDGDLVVRGGTIFDNNGKISGTVSSNDGTVSTNDFIADYNRFGIYNSAGEFVPLFFLDLSNPNDPELVFRGRAEFGGYSVSSESDIRALDGEKGAGRYETATSTGAWSNATANNYFGGNPSGGDVLTIYKSSDPKVQNTRIYQNGSWQAFALHVHGSAIIDESLSVSKIYFDQAFGNNARFEGEVYAGKLIGEQASAISLLTKRRTVDPSNDTASNGELILDFNIASQDFPVVVVIDNITVRGHADVFAAREAVYVNGIVKGNSNAMFVPTNAGGTQEAITGKVRLDIPANQSANVKVVMYYHILGSNSYLYTVEEQEVLVSVLRASELITQNTI